MIFRVLILCALPYTSGAQLYPLALDVMAGLNSQWFVAVAAFGNASTLLAPHIAHLPKPVWLWTHFHDESFHLYKSVLEHEARLSKVAIFLPWRTNLPEDFVAKLDELAHLAVQTHWVISTKEKESLDWVKTLPVGACQVVTVSETSIQEPVNGYSKCNAQRKNTSVASQVFSLREAAPTKYPANLKLKIVSPYRLKPDGHTDVVPEVAAVLLAYFTLNTTVILFGRHEWGMSDVLVQSRLADMDIFPTTFSWILKNRFYFYAMYPPCHICFFTRRVQGKVCLLLEGTTTIISSVFTIAVFALVMIIMYRCLECQVNSKSVSPAVLFLTSTFFGRAPCNIRCSLISTKILLASWMFGTFFVGCYLQSQITADIYAPSSVREVENIEALQKLMDSGNVLPCIDRTSVPALYHNMESEFSKKLTSTIRSRAQECVVEDAMKTCCRLGLPQKRVCVRPCCSYDVILAHQHGLMKGSGDINMYQRVSLMLRNFPQRQQHRRLLLAISESGLDFFQERKAGVAHPSEGIITVKYPFFNYLWAFAIGCVSATFAVCFELLSARTVSRCRTWDDSNNEVRN
ncbi:hypothetical protein HPB48_023658 [Haemaphysalis longicornis]|uniref:Ionotropic receptor n=1 Tax=Haemaphysalis longicornis TaxID=44386 RepID=A0A9J6H7C1_HAELO|nr:hypothetical protein HPB48_023658 [Haemaphysalis longicornis]